MDHTISMELSVVARDAKIRHFRMRCAQLMWLFLFLFVLRVIGQMLVAFFGVTFLPPMPEWYSGLLSYPILLPIQWIIIVVFAAICIGLSRGKGRLARANRRTGAILLPLSMIYFGSMIVRYVITMAIRPDRRWFHGTIPIAFHLVLASYLFVLARYHSVVSES